MKVCVELKGHDSIIYERENDRSSFDLIVCSSTRELLKKCKAQFGADVSAWEEPQGIHHSEILVRELIQKVRGTWNFPYAHSELCHCRAVSASGVDAAILQGAHTIASVGRLTLAGTGCGKCQSDIATLLKHRGIKD